MEEALLIQGEGCPYHEQGELVLQTGSFSNAWGTSLPGPVVAGGCHAVIAYIPSLPSQVFPTGRGSSQPMSTYFVPDAVNKML